MDIFVQTDKITQDFDSIELIFCQVLWTAYRTDSTGKAVKASKVLEKVLTQPVQRILRNLLKLVSKNDFKIICFFSS